MFRGVFEKGIEYLERITLYDPIAINVETLRIDSESSLEKEFTMLIHINP